MTSDSALKQRTTRIQTFWNLQRCTSIVTVFGALLIATSEVMVAQETALSPDSDGGGTSFSLDCGENKVLIGVAGGAGQWVDRVRGICSEINNAGEWIGPETRTAATATGAGTDFTLRCPANNAVNALSGRAGQWVDKLQVHCRPLGAGGTVTGSLVLARDGSSTSVGGSSGTTGFGPNQCASDHPARRLRGFAGSVLGTPTIDRVGLDCPSPSPFKLTSLLALYATTLGNTSSAVLEFNHNAPEAQTVALSIPSQAVISIPSTATISAGSHMRGFTVSTVQTGCAMITATYAGASRVAHIVVQPDRELNYPLWMSTPDQLLISPQQQTVQLAAAVPVGSVITLQSSNPNVASVPASITKTTLTGTMTFPVTGIRRGCTQIVATYGGRTVRRIVKVEEIGG